MVMGNHEILPSNLEVRRADWDCGSPQSSAHLGGDSLRKTEQVCCRLAALQEAQRAEPPADGRSACQRRSRKFLLHRSLRHSNLPNVADRGREHGRKNIVLGSLQMTN